MRPATALARAARPFLCLLALLTGAGVAAVAEPAAGAGGGAAAPAPNPHLNCTCRAQGRSYHIGERVCLSTPKGYRVAECRMQQNVTTWSVGAEDCSVSAGGRPPPPAAGRPPRA